MIGRHLGLVDGRATAQHDLLVWAKLKAVAKSTVVEESLLVGKVVAVACRTGQSEKINARHD